MKITRSKTRKGILNWLAKLNPSKKHIIEQVNDEARIVAISVYKDTGELRCYITDTGVEIENLNDLNILQFRAAA